MADTQVRTIRLGLGEVVSVHGTSNGKPAVIIEPADTPGLVGYDAGERPELHPNAVVLEIHDCSGVEVLVDDLRRALEKRGWPVPFEMKRAAQPTS